MATKCPKCNADNPNTSRFCADCGTQIISIKDVSVTKTIQEPIVSSGKIIAGKYKILDELGRGGMGVVYRAKDTRLKRTVALKFLPAELTQDKEAKKRFIQEAQAAAALEHPNICTVYEVDEADEQTFIAMSYIKGQSLKDKLKEGPLANDEAKGIALQVAEGLKEAHKKGIIHRDIKPANIMITDEGQTKITDFGLAKLSWGVDLTKTSTIMGTVAYMSPEQARGEEVDFRTDIWSLGAMLYEMVTGERPFKKDQEHALIYAILNDKPTPLSLLRSDVPAHIEQASEKALAKKVSERYKNVDDLIQDLKQSIPIVFPKTEKSIIVLPFENLSPDPEQEYFCDGMTEEIISDLSKVQTLQVISRSSAMTFKDTKKKIKEIAKEVNVQYVLEGSVRKAGNNLRITAQLIEAINDVHLWAEKYSGTLDDIFDIQEKVSRCIVDALKLQLSPQENKKIAERPIDNVQAYECYTKAQQDIWDCTEESLDRAIRRIKNGLKIIGDNELLYAALGSAYNQYVGVAYRTDECHIRKTEECADKVFELNPDSSFGHILRGRIHFTRRYMQEAVQEIKRGLASDPNNVDGLLLLIVLYFLSGKTSAARAPLKKMREIDPLSPWNYGSKGWVELYEGQFNRAAQSFGAMYQMDPGNPVFRYLYSMALGMNRQVEEACSVVDLILKDTPQIFLAGLGTFLKHAWHGEADKALEIVNPSWTKSARFDETFSWHGAAGYALIQKKDEALDWLENSVDKGAINYPFFSEYCPWFENIRDEPRFKKLMQRVKHEWENFEV